MRGATPVVVPVAISEVLDQPRMDGLARHPGAGAVADLLRLGALVAARVRVETIALRDQTRRAVGPIPAEVAALKEPHPRGVEQPDAHEAVAARTAGFNPGVGRVDRGPVRRTRAGVEHASYRSIGWGEP